LLTLLALWGALWGALGACTSGNDDTGDSGPCAGGPYTDFYLDFDSDGFGDAGNIVEACQAPQSHVAEAGDCDDQDATIHPDATEICGNGIDDNCDESPDTCGASGLMSAETGGATLLGSGDAGRSVAGVGDVNGDGLDDVLIGAPETDWIGSSSGIAILMTGSLTGELILVDSGTVFSGTNPGDRAGFAVAGAGDLNQDGFDDLLVGAPHTDAGGAAYLIHGPATGNIDLEASASRVWTAQIPDDRAGQAVAGAGDTDGDGVPDVLIGAPEAGRGLVYLLRGPTGPSDTLAEADAIIQSELESPSTGFALAAGDTDGDGLSDVLVGCPQDNTNGNETGAAYLFTGPVEGTVSTDSASAGIFGQNPLDWAGSAVAVGDLNADGHEDLVIGAYRVDVGGMQSGAVYVIYGPISSGGNLANADLKLVGSADQEHVGISVAVVADHDGDGAQDLLIGADRASDDRGGAYLITGPLQGNETLGDAHALVVGPNSGDRLGASVASAGDTDGDGTTDLLLGAPLFREDGAAFLILGGPGY
jgi:hypothetical protein